MRRLPPPHEPDEKTYAVAVAPRTIGLALGLLFGYLLLPVSAGEPAAAPTPPAVAPAR